MWELATIYNYPYYPTLLANAGYVKDVDWLEYKITLPKVVPEKLEKIASKTSFVQAKTYFGGGEWYSLELDYPRIIQILKKVNYQGYISIEFEGKEPASTGVKKSVELLRKALG